MYDVAALGELLIDFTAVSYTHLDVYKRQQTYLLDESDNSADKFLKRFDTEWKRYNRDLIRKVQEYEKGMEDAQ